MDSIASLALFAETDEVILEKAYKTNSIILTQDSDFGKLIFAAKKPFLGLIYFRPGSITLQRQTDLVQFLLDSEIDIEPPFIIVVNHFDEKINLRVRNAVSRT